MQKLLTWGQGRILPCAHCESWRQAASRLKSNQESCRNWRRLPDPSIRTPTESIKERSPTRTGGRQRLQTADSKYTLPHLIMCAYQLIECARQTHTRTLHTQSGFVLLTRTLAQCSVVEFVINFDCEFVCFKLTRTAPANIYIFTFQSQLKCLMSRSSGLGEGTDG
jgi:hypothetical protein